MSINNHLLGIYRRLKEYIFIRKFYCFFFIREFPAISNLNLFLIPFFFITRYIFVTYLYLITENERVC